jgi:hypothetical protein
MYTKKNCGQQQKDRRLRYPLCCRLPSAVCRLHGITLIEIVVALVLSVLLLTTTAGVIKSMQERKNAFADRLDVQPWRLELAERLHDDMLRSREMRIGARSLELLGFSGHDPTTGEAMSIPVHVRWVLKKEDGYDILIRIETPQGGLEELTTPPRSELIAVGVTSFSIGSFSVFENESRDEMRTIEASTWRNDEMGHWITMPRVLRLLIHGPDNIVLVNELIYR